MTDWSDPEQTIDRFRQWLAQVRFEAGETAREVAAATPGNTRSATVPVADEAEFTAAALGDVVAAFTALRQELKLQTRSARDLGEQTERLLAGLSEAMRRFDTVEPDEKKAVRHAAEPLAEGLTGLDEALERGLVALEQARRQVLDNSAPAMHALLDELYERQPWWRRWMGRHLYQAARAGWLEQAAEAQRPAWDSLQEGYRLIQSRLRRSMQACGLRRIPALGRPVDPHCMTVVEVADDSAHPPGTVVAELRPGYFWNDTVLRFAEVRVVRGPSGSPPVPAASLETETDSGEDKEWDA